MKKFLALLLVLVIGIGAGIGGTVAYLQDTDEDVNVMTLGSVHIAQHEYERVVNADGTYKTATIDEQTSYVLKDFTQGKDLVPIVGDPSLPGDDPGYAGWDTTTVRMSQVDSYGGMDVFAGKNAQDKFVTVENTGKTAAYVRTIVAIEVGSADPDLIGTSYHGNWTKNVIGVVAIDEVNYNVIEYVYKGAKLSDGSWRHENGILPAGDTTYPNLSQVYIKSKATNEDMVKIDGNGNGTLDILVFSQAVQADGFENAETALNAAFGDITTNNHPWSETAPVIPIITSDAEDVADVMTNGGVLILEDSVKAETNTIANDAVVKIELNDKTLDSVIENNGDLEISGGTLKGDYMNNYGDATITDTKIEMGTPANYAVISRAGSKTVYENVEIVSGGGGVAAADGAIVVFNSGSVAVNSACTSGRYLFYAEGEGSEIVINDGTFSFSKTLNQKRAYVYAGADTTVIINGGNFGPASTRSGYTAGILGAGEVIIKGGTFGFDPSNWVADGYEAVKDGTTWTVSAK